ncbi:MAG: SLBB domain-containing protein [Bacteroidaceae bacterium]|nr:SLBB domain-containing protein [Bacteroidaceae bacterium]
MKKIVFLFLMLLSVQMVVAQGMSDQQVIQFMQKEAKAGTSQAQIVTKLMQRGVKVEQIQRLRKQYADKMKNSSMGAAAEKAADAAEDRMRKANAATNRTMGMSDGETIGAADDYVQLSTRAVAPADSIDNLFHGKKVFGRDIFNNKNLNFEPNMNLATPQNYVLGPGDKVYVDIYGASQKTEELTISPDGDITVPGYGPIHVSGLSVSGAQGKLRSTLGSRYASSNIKLTVGQTRTIQVNVMGEVVAPGSYTLSAFATVFHALYMAGGTNSIGTLRNIKVYRQGKLVSTVDVYQYILSGRLAGNIRLQDNDVIQVGPYDCIVDIAGNVKRPMAFEMRKTESVKTLLDYAGGFTANAYKDQIRLIRRSGRLKTVYNIKEFDMNGFKVADGDSLSVDSMLDRYENMVEVRGAVFRSGMYRLGQEVTSVKSLIEAADGLMEEAMTSRAVIRRVKPNRTFEVISVDVQGIMDGTVADEPLHNEDILFIPTLQERLTERTVTIQGEVQFPGTYEYADNETIEDLVLRAGGLTDAASTVKVDVSRRIRDSKALSSGDEISKNFTFALKDGFVIDGAKGFTLEPYDVVQVRKSPGYIEPRSVRVEGEVAFGGQFSLSKKNQRLSDLIQAAGGVTSQAYVKGARLERTMTDDEKVRLQAAIEAAKQNAADKDSINLDQLETASVYTVGIDLEKALANPGGDYDIVVRENDRLIIPEYNGTVKISGNVLFPNTVAYMNGKSWKYYVNQAGGFGDRSKKSKTYIVYQNGTVSQVGKGKIEPGCEIIVPRKGKKDMTNIMQWVSIGTSMASLATMFATIGNLLK